MGIQPIRVVIQGIDQFSSTIAQSQKKIEKLGKKISDVGNKMTVGLTIPIVAMGALSVQSAAQFEKSMVRVGAVTGATAEQLSAMTTMARNMGKNSMWSATQSADAMKLMADSGFNSQQIMEGLPSVLKLSTIAAIDMTKAVNIADNVLEGFGKTTKDLPFIVNQFAQAAKLGGIGIEQISDSMTNIGPVAQSFGIDIEEMMTVVSRFGNLGVDISAATFAMRIGLAKLAKPGAEAIKVFERLNIKRGDVFDEDGKLRSLIGLMELLKSRGATTADMINIFSTRAGPMMATFLEKGMGGIRDLEASITSAGATGDELLKSQEASMSGRLEKINAAFEELKLTIGETLLPVIEPLVDKISMAFTWFSSLSLPVKNLAMVLAGVLAVIGPLLVGLGAVVSAVASISAVIASAGGIIVILSNPIGWVIGAILLLITAITAMKMKFDMSIKSIATGMLALSGPIGWVVGALIQNWSKVLPFLKLIGEGFKLLGNIIMFAMWPVFKILESFGNLIEWITGSILDMISALTRIVLPKWLEEKIGLTPAPRSASPAQSLAERVGMVNRNENETKIIIEDRAGVKLKSETQKGTLDTEVLRGLGFQGAY